MSLRGRLLLAAATMVLIALVAADVTTYLQLRSYLYKQVDQSLQTSQPSILVQISGEAPVRQSVGGGTFFVQLRDAQDTPTVYSQATDPGHGDQISPKLPPHITDLRPAGVRGEPLSVFTAPSETAGGPSLRVRVSAVTFVDRRTGLRSDGQLIIAVPLAREARTLHRLAGVEFAVTGLALLTVIMLGWWLVRLSLRPLAEMEETAAAIAHGELGRRVPGEDATTEVGKLARTLNTMLERIQEAFAARDATESELRQSEERLRRFVADASHELRTPLTAVGAYAELFERGAADRPEDLVRVMSGIRAETARMGELVGDLLLLARLDEGRPLERQSVELVGLASEAIAAAVAVGPAWPVQLIATQAIEVTGDGARLRQVLDNLLNNVRAHTPPGTATTVRVGAHGDYGVLEVADDGPGLADQDLGRVFERFYRADASRSRHSGGSGLGLAIVAAIVAAHGGQVVAGRSAGGGAMFTVWLPVTIAPAVAPLAGDGANRAPDPPPAMAHDGSATATS